MNSLVDTTTSLSIAAETAKGRLLINADDWGRDVRTTKMTYDCICRGTVSSVSAMVHMQDSIRAAEVARESRIDAGLHLNFTTRFSSAECPARLLDHQYRLICFLQRYSFATAIYHPLLVRSFEYVLESQFDEYRRTYGKDPDRIDGHHHMHLCTNVLLGGLLPPGRVVRRYFSPEPGQNIRVRMYRRLTDALLASRYVLTDFFFSLTPIQPPNRLRRIFSLAHSFVVEVETHPINADEYQFLIGGQILHRIEPYSLATHFVTGSKP